MYSEDAIARFETKFEKKEGCWLCRIGRFLGKAPPRFSWEVYRGEIPEGSCVLHHCDVPECVNPDHLYVGTNLDNGRDRAERRLYPRGRRNPNSKITAELVLEIKKLHALGNTTLVEIVNMYDISYRAVSIIIHGSKFNHVPEKRKEMRRYSKFRLTDREVGYILELHSLNLVTIAEIAEVFDVSGGTISSIVRGLSYKHVPRDQAHA